MGGGVLDAATVGELLKSAVNKSLGMKPAGAEMPWRMEGT